MAECLLCRKLGASTSRNSTGLSRPVMGSPYCESAFEGAAITCWSVTVLEGEGNWWDLWHV